MLNVENSRSTGSSTGFELLPPPHSNASMSTLLQEHNRTSLHTSQPCSLLFLLMTEESLWRHCILVVRSTQQVQIRGTSVCTILIRSTTSSLATAYHNRWSDLTAHSTMHVQICGTDIYAATTHTNSSQIYSTTSVTSDILTRCDLTGTVIIVL